MEVKKLYVVKNRSASEVVYNIPEEGIRRSFMPGESKNITLEELQKLSYQAGGMEILANFLQVQSDEAADNLNIPRELEYDMSEQQVVELLRNGSLDALLDALDFAPTGVIDLIKHFSIALPLNDIAKCKAIYEKTGFNVTQALANAEADKEENKEAAQEKPATRRVQAEEKTATPAPTRRTNTQYKVVTPKA